MRGMITRVDAIKDADGRGFTGSSKLFGLFDVTAGCVQPCLDTAIETKPGGSAPSCVVHTVAEYEQCGNRISIGDVAHLK